MLKQDYNISSIFGTRIRGIII